mmetsp:Transcript_12316/g.25112  ORF Transcript_12316/g.25112 Transcript_12316/m.25112 type:complete len:310 (-) Transcript_12316:411-1340(-)
MSDAPGEILFTRAPLMSVGSLTLSKKKKLKTTLLTSSPLGVWCVCACVLCRVCVCVCVCVVSSSSVSRPSRHVPQPVHVRFDRLREQADVLQVLLVRRHAPPLHGFAPAGPGRRTRRPRHVSYVGRRARLKGQRPQVPPPHPQAAHVLRGAARHRRPRRAPELHVEGGAGGRRSGGGEGQGAVEPGAHVRGDDGGGERRGGERCPRMRGQPEGGLRGGHQELQGGGGHHEPPSLGAPSPVGVARLYVRFVRPPHRVHGRRLQGLRVHLPRPRPADGRREGPRGGHGQLLPLGQALRRRQGAGGGLRKGP